MQTQTHSPTLQPKLGFHTVIYHFTLRFTLKWNGEKWILKPLLHRGKQDLNHLTQFTFCSTSTNLPPKRTTSVQCNTKGIELGSLFKYHFLHLQMISSPTDWHSNQRYQEEQGNNNGILSNTPPPFAVFLFLSSLRQRWQRTQQKEQQNFEVSMP